ncbi:MAG: AAA family ATPase [Acidobacteria bacterium]|nr:AAA family ATPase [Acidobacteriota bacterium]MYF13884.1 AAA family ATPase [Acidobacteriota bacterium]MYI95855.1 AAA family ATPase [Acidobacteriota bacterium]
MLHWLRAQNVALLTDVYLEFEAGLNVVTGETGVGKSVLLEALGLILGGRGRTQLVGPAADRAVVEAGFTPPEAEPSDRERFRALAQEAGFPVEDGDLMIRRELRLTPGRRSISNRITVNGTAVPVAVLRALGPVLAEIYSQGEYLALLQPGAARETVDEAGGHAPLRRDVAAAFRALRAREAERDALQERLAAAAVQRAEMERALEEIERAAPQPGEVGGLLEERRALGHAEQLAGRLENAYQALYGSDSAAGAQLAVALRALEEAGVIDPRTAGLLDGRPDLLVEVEDLAAAVRDRRDSVRAAPERLAEIEDRLVVLRGLERRYAGGMGGPDALLARATEIRDALAELTDQAEERRRAVAVAAAAAARYRERAESLRAVRQAAADALARGVQGELVGLGIPRARFSIAMEPLPEVSGPGEAAGTGHFTEHGLDRVEFLFTASAEMAPAPIGEVASGGESSRFFLALKAAGAGKGGAATLVFDEADTGTSGRIADAVGRRLRRLAASRQVVSVTHLPQVAALGRAHLVVEKLESGDAVRVSTLVEDARIEEIARMLAGPEVTDSARRHASQLLAGADADAPGGETAGFAAEPAGR